MRLAKKIILIVLVLLIVAYAAASVFISVQGKRIAIARISELTGRQVQVKSVRMSGPLHFTIDQINVEGIGKAASVEISPSIWALMAGKTDLHSILIVKPEVTFTVPGPVTPPVAAAVQPQEEPVQTQKQSQSRSPAERCRFSKLPTRATPSIRPIATTWPLGCWDSWRSARKAHYIRNSCCASRRSKCSIATSR